MSDNPLKNKRFAISIGRRQPMHRMHLDCLREILDAGLKPIIIVGSVNGADSPLYDPINNPLTFSEEKEQLRLALPSVDNLEIFPLMDLGNLDRWCASVVDLVRNRLGECVMHYRAKKTDADNGIAPLSASEEIFARLGLESWRTTNKNPQDDLLNSSDLRMVAYDNPRLEKDLAVPGYIRGLMQQAREQNPDASLLKNTPITLLDLTLLRLYREAGVSTAKLLENSDNLRSSVTQFLASRRAPL